MRLSVVVILAISVCGVVEAGGAKTGAANGSDMKLWYEQAAKHWQGHFPFPIFNSCFVAKRFATSQSSIAN